MENYAKHENKEPEIVLSRKEQLLEIIANAICFMLLFGCLLKVLFF